MRLLALIVGLALVPALALAGGPAGAAAPGSFYLVRPDLRLCPSPLCGGAWVRRTNHATTRCLDGRLRRECYVATLSGPAPASSGARSASWLARGRLVPARVEGFHGLAMLAVGASWRPAGRLEPRGTTFRVVDNGIRCVTTPCFSLTAFALESAGRRTLSTLDLDAARLTRDDRARAEAALATGGLLVTGAVRTVPDAGPAGAGRTLVATPVWLPAAP